MSNRCPDCGNVLPAGAPLGFCPTCLLRGGLTMPEMETSAFQAVKTPNAEGLESRIMGRYKLGEKLGEGGFGVVYEAEQRGAIQRDVAVKVLKSDVNTGQIIARFEAERQALALMDHPAIARVLDAGETQDGRPFFVMEKVLGPPITEFVRTQKLPLEERLRLFVTVCDAVHHAHQKGIIHRDIKPSNILITEESGTSQPKVIDFGIAKAVNAPLTTRTIYTQFDQVMGTPGYISPEQVERGAEAVDVRSDVYALGALLHELLTDLPVVNSEDMKGRSLHVALLEIARRQPPRPSAARQDLRGDLDAITLKAMALEPERRYGSASALADDVQHFLRHEPVQARVPGALYLARKFTQRHRFAVTAGVALLTTLAAATVLIWLSYLRADAALKLAGQREVETRLGYSREHFEAGRRDSERGRVGDAVTHLCRALRADPGNTFASTYLTSLLMQTHMGHPLPAQLKPLKGYDRMIHVGVNARLRQVLAVCQPTGDEAEGKPDMLSRWDLTSEERQDMSMATGARVTAFVMTEDEESAVLGLSDGSLVRYDVAAARFTQFQESMGTAISALAVTRDSRAVVAGTKSGRAQLWDLEKHEPVAAAVDLGGPAQGIACNFDATTAVAFSGSDVVSFAPRRSKLLRGPQRLPGVISTVAITRDGRLMAVGLRTGYAWMLSVADLQLHGAPLAHVAPVSTLSFNPDDRVLTSGDEKGYVFTWQAANARPVAPAQAMDGAVLLCRNLSQRGTTLAVTAGGELRRWEAGPRTMTTHRSRSTSAVATSHDGTLSALVMKSEPVIQLWEMHARMLEPRFVGPNAPPDDQCTSSEHAVTTQDPKRGRMVLLAGSAQISTDATRNVRITDAASGRRLTPDLRHDQDLKHLAVTPDGRTLLTITSDGVHRCWDVATGNALMPPWKKGETANALRLARDGSRYFYERAVGGWFEMPLPQRDAVAPEWFVAFAEAYTGRRLLADGTSENVRRDFSRVPNRPSPQPFESIAHWLLTPAQERPLWPGDTQSFAGYLKSLRDSGDVTAAREAARFVTVGALAD